MQHWTIRIENGPKLIRGWADNMLIMGVEVVGGRGGGRVPRSRKISGDVPTPRNDDISVSFS